ncbi:Formylmethanofuran dehydrogenase subunit E [Archaeoglobus sulfaticallidus PM70-1]|uniref:Formylmethanofuran dehydrogenase subunit E n=1 Tax=Archaeoglobus sulfaticallidus PM70-1 TaxID=387631 RepID=N0BBS2_9EURY|nr:FmdE family protein [Archaeoglobus sulfaticallidus]AGK60448.1 Formylmethanofuran dehydrogenase subunit E [Archaeoglobus sulfaticallidus PM70-1]
MGKDDDVYRLIETAKQFHGHICPFLVLGIKASVIALNKLGIDRAEYKESVGEEILAIVECNNCFADGVQIATGCTFGNNSLIYADIGKNAVTVVKRGEWKGIRVYVDAENIRSKYFPKDVLELFDRVIVRREGDEKELEEFRQLWEDIGRELAGVPEEDFWIKEVNVKPIERAPIFNSLRCSVCGELVMETKTRKDRDGKVFCLACLDHVHSVVGRGIEHFNPFEVMK